MSATRILEDFVEATAEIVREAGGWVNGEMGIATPKGGSGLVITCPAPNGAPLVVVPPDCFLPVGAIPWGDGPILEITGALPDLQPLTREMLMVQIGLHNARDAVGQVAMNHPQLAPGLDETLVASVRRFRQHFRVAPPTPAALFWSNRCFRLESEDGVARPMAVPLVDLLNHRDGASEGALHPEGFFVAVDHGSPEVEWECLLDYGRQRDALGMAVVYGFCDESNPRAHSAPMRLEVATVGIVVVSDRGRDRSGTPVAVRSSASEGHLLLSHITFDARRGFDATVETLISSTGLPRHIAASVLRAVGEENLALLDAISTRAHGRGDQPAAMTLAGAARVQHQTIKRVLTS